VDGAVPGFRPKDATDRRAPSAARTSAQVAAVADPEGRLVPPGAGLALLPTAEQIHDACEAGIGLRPVGVRVSRWVHAELWLRLTEWIGRQAHPIGSRIAMRAAVFKVVYSGA
jgi:hypothetical protein